MSGKRLRQEDRVPKRPWRLGLILLLLAVAAAILVAALLLRPKTTTPAVESSPTQSAQASASESTETPEEPDPEPELEPEPEPEPEPTEEEIRAQQVQQLLSNMTLEEKVAQLFIVTPEQLTGVSGTVTQCGAVSQAAIQSTCVGGIIYFAANLVDRQQTMDMISGLQEAAPLGLFIAVDEEGGSVSRLGRNSAMGVTRFSDMASVADAEEAYQVGLTLGSELQELGFNLDFAPVADVNSNPNNPVIGTRAFSADAETAAQLVAACVSGFADSGTLCTLKHFPGHGDTATDSHLGAATTDKTLEQLQSCEYLPFQAGIDAGADLVMVGHISAPEVTGDDTPASLSYELVTGQLRQALGFDGLVVTDSLSMGAITQNYAADEAAVLALQAGVDLLLMPEDLNLAMNGVLDAVADGRLSQERIDESVTRILTVKLERGILSADAVEAQ